MPDVSLVATLVATILSFALGGLWYGPIFGNAWMAEHGFTKDQLTRDFNAVKTYGATFVLAFISSYLFGLYVGHDPSMTAALHLAVVIGVGWVATSIATNYLFERRSLALTMINGGYHALRFLLTGVAFALLG